MKMCRFVSRGLRNCFALVAVSVSTAWGGVFDDAMAWWKFGRGGADGAVATAAQLGDARDSSLNRPSGFYGQAGGPLWSEMEVRLPHQRRTVRETALHFPCDLRLSGSTPQCWYTSLAFTNLQNHGAALTVVARVRLEGNGISAADAMLWDNAFNWGSNAGSAMGFIKCASADHGSIVTYVPYGFVGKNTFGNAAADKVLAMKVGEWYDVAYLFNEETVSGTRTDVVTFVVADAGGVRTQTIRKASVRGTTTSTTYARMGCMTHISDWTAYNAADITINTSDTLKNFDGWVHQLAVWNRRLTLDEVKEAFGRPAEHPEQDIFSESVNWMRFDKDIDGDGKVDFDEMRDVRHWNCPSNGQPVAISQTGPQGGPVWTNMTVNLPGRGVSFTSPCLYFPIVTNVTTDSSGATVYSAWPTTLKFANLTCAGSYTVMARIYPQRQFGALANVPSYFYNNGLDWAAWSGSEFGLYNGADRTGDTFYPHVLLAHTNYDATDLPMTTNTWYDIAFSITDNGFDANGKALTDTALVAVQDAKLGFRWQSLNVGTNAYTTLANWYGRVQLGGESAYGGLKDFYKPQTSEQISAGNAVKAFSGAIHALVIWNRALTTNEIAAAFSDPCNMVMRVGTADGAAGEFAGTAGTYDCNVDATGTVWRAISGTLDATHPELTLRFTPEKNNVSAVQYLHVKAADVGTGDGQKARLRLTLNSRAVAEEKDIGSHEDLWCILPRRMLRAGENVLKIAYAAGGTASAFALDSAEIVGSWQVGAEDGQVGDFSQEGGGRVTPNFTVGDRNLKHVCRAVTSSWKNNYISFYVPAELAARHAFTFTSDFCDFAASMPASASSAFALYLNGTQKYAAPAGKLPAKRERFAFTTEPGELAPGWNTINMRYTSSVSGGWLTFDFFKFEISDYHTGMMLLFR